MVWNFRMQWKRTWAPTEVCVGILSDPEYCLGLEMVRCQINMNWLSDSSNEAWSVYFLFLEVVAFFWIPQLLIHTVDGNTLHIQYDRTRLDIAMRHSDFPASGAKSQSHARPSWSKAIEHLECGGCLSLDPTGAGQQIHGCWGRIHQVEPRDVGESQFWRALRNDLVMLEHGISTSQWRHVCSRCIKLLRAVWFLWFLCQGYHSWRMGRPQNISNTSQVKGWTKFSPLKNSQSWNSQTPRWLSSPWNSEV